MTAANREARTLSRKLIKRSLHEYFQPCPTATLTPPSDESDPWLAFDWRTRRYTFRQLYASDTVVYLSSAEFEVILLARSRWEHSRSRFFERIAVPLALFQRHPEALRVLGEYFTRLSYVMVVVNDLDDRQGQQEQELVEPQQQHQKKKKGWWVDISYWAQGKYLGPDPPTAGVGDWIHGEKAMFTAQVYDTIQEAYRRVYTLDRSQLRIRPVRACHKEAGWIGMAAGSRYSGVDMALQVSPIEPLMLTAPHDPVIRWDLRK
ncbi:hypothetical protein BO86DRAFT_380665 [Aspergillus japonicus CBS 114.51]|uniref:Uncharacterized protein n=1 Tax=Aspergillus japonicus CBS 114.51 TaxID=1448312 RepID=A0A8T8WWS4_ASPJA|nr:hypothetical protein BO86DRAFT_380665 [Aspergillus japonicus CBS 114.51]RAH80114.1 hypothetical protein BO86DRAFT_380665 [Aspergillus japonicus CBS 114.51]